LVRRKSSAVAPPLPPSAGALLVPASLRFTSCLTSVL
jgi:hypothetical protein